MGTIQKHIHDIHEHQHPLWMGVLRIILGLILLIKGIGFVSNTDAILSMLHRSNSEFISVALAHYVAFAHLIGGIMIIFGLLTRWAVVPQIPILLGAILFVNARTGFFSLHSELFLSIITLILLIVFLWYGSGPISVDEQMRKNAEMDLDNNN